MSSKSRLTLGLLLVLLFASQLRTIAIEPQASEDIIPPNAVLIRNGSSQPIRFWLRNGSSPWVQFQLGPRDDRVYSNVDQIWIATVGQEPAHRKLELKQRYKIIWDGTRWDVARIAIRS